MESLTQKILNNFKSSLVRCSIISNITNDSFNPYLLTSPRNFISGPKIASPIKISLTKRQQNLNNYFIESHFAKTNSLNKNILSPKNKTHRTLYHYNSQPNQSYSLNNIENYTTNCLSTTSRTEMRRNSNKPNIKLLNRFENYNKNYVKKNELNYDNKKRYLMKRINDMTQKFKDENPFNDEKRYNIFLRKMMGDNSQIKYIINNNKKNGSSSKNKVYSEINKIYFNYLMTDPPKTQNIAKKNKILEVLKKLNNINKAKKTNFKKQKIYFTKNKSINVFPNNKNLYITNKSNLHKLRSFSDDKININLNDLLY